MPAWVTVILALSLPVATLAGVWLAQRGAAKVARQTLEGQRTLADDEARRELRRQQVAPYLEAASRRIRAWLDLFIAMAAQNNKEGSEAFQKVTDHEWWVLASTYLAIPDERFKVAFKQLRDAEDWDVEASLGLVEVQELLTKVENAVVLLNAAAEQYIFSVPQSGDVKRSPGEPKK